MNQFDLPLTSRPSRVGSDLAPLHALAPIQRIGYLDSTSEIRCLKPIGGFTAGLDYRVLTSTFRSVDCADKERLDGGVDEVELSAQEMGVGVVNDACKIVTFSSGKRGGADHGFDILVDAFELPSVPDVATVKAKDYQRNLAVMEMVEQNIRELEML